MIMPARIMERSIACWDGPHFRPDFTGLFAARKIARNKNTSVLQASFIGVADATNGMGVHNLIFVSGLLLQ
jgi:hypothetical protein